MSGVENARSIDMEEFGRMFGMNELAVQHDSGYTVEDVLALAVPPVEDVQGSARERFRQVEMG